MDKSDMFYGEVIWFSSKSGFGFLSWTKDEAPQKDMFVHFSDVECAGFKTLYKGQHVTFELGKNKNGVDKAINVKVLNH